MCAITFRAFGSVPLPGTGLRSVAISPSTPTSASTIGDAIATFSCRWTAGGCSRIGASTWTGLQPTALCDELRCETVRVVDVFGPGGALGCDGQPGHAHRVQLCDRGVPFVGRPAVVEQGACRETDVQRFGTADLGRVFLGPGDGRRQFLKCRDLSGP